MPSTSSDEVLLTPAKQERSPEKLQAELAQAMHSGVLRGRRAEVPVTLTTVWRRVALNDVTVFTRQLATLVGSGLPLQRALKSLGQGIRDPLFRSQVEGVAELLAGGKSFSESLRKYPQTFDTLYVSLIEAAEISGTLDEILMRLSLHLEASVRLRQQVRTAVVYPLAIVLIALVVMGLMLFKVVPSFDRMFASAGAALPPETLLVVALSDMLQQQFGWIILGSISAFALVVLSYLTPVGRDWIDERLLRLPGVGELIVQIELARFSRTLATLIGGGVSILVGLDICVKTSSNRMVEAALRQVRFGVSQGYGLGESLRATRRFPETLPQMVSVGENTGQLDSMLGRIADYYDQEVEGAVGAMVALLEPALMIFIGVVVGGLLIAMYMPIFTMTTLTGG
ncbi:MAG: type II secretion system F family protein [Myxococcota bacterium]